VTIEPSAPSPTEPAPPEPAGASLSLQRTACFGACPTYEVTLFESGVAVYRGREHVTVVGDERRAIDPAKVGALLREADELFARKGLPTKPAGCGTDAPVFVLTIRRGDVVHTRRISTSCTMQIGDESADRVREHMRTRGLDYDAFIAAGLFADRIDLAVPTEPWVDDPACRDLQGTLLSPPLAPVVDTELETRRKQLEEWMVDRIRRTSDLSLRIRAPFSTDVAIVAAHRDRLLARGIPMDRVVVERMRHATRDFAFRGVELTIGPSYCFAAVRAAERLEVDRKP
jgi:hypothetical protein